MKIRPVGPELFHARGRANGRKDTHDEANSRFSQLVTWRATTIFTRYSMSYFIRHFIILSANQALIPSIGVLPSGDAMLHYIVYIQLFLQP